MGRSVVITTPIPTADELAKQLHIGKRRLATIKRIVDGSISEAPDPKRESANKSKPAMYEKAAH
jgi:hypothetical protein